MRLVQHFSVWCLLFAAVSTGLPISQLGLERRVELDRVHLCDPAFAGRKTEYQEQVREKVKEYCDREQPDAVAAFVVNDTHPSQAEESDRGGDPAEHYTVKVLDKDGSFTGFHEGRKTPKPIDYHEPPPAGPRPPTPPSTIKHGEKKTEQERKSAKKKDKELRECGELTK